MRTCICDIASSKRALLRPSIPKTLNIKGLAKILASPLIVWGLTRQFVHGSLEFVAGEISGMCEGVVVAGVGNDRGSVCGGFRVEVLFCNAL